MRIVKAATSDGFKRRKKGQPSRRHPHPTLSRDEKRVAGEGGKSPNPAGDEIAQQISVPVTAPDAVWVYSSVR